MTLARSLTPEAAEREIPALAALLEDAVDGGASVGFLAPMVPGEARAYWATVVEALREGSRVLIVVRDDADVIVGAGRLELAMRPNARHRAEVARRGGRQRSAWRVVRSRPGPWRGRSR